MFLNFTFVHRHRTIVAVVVASYSRTGRGFEVARPLRDHRVHASFSRTAWARILRREVERPVHDLANGPCVRYPGSRHTKSQEAGRPVRRRVGGDHDHTQSVGDV